MLFFFISIILSCVVMTDRNRIKQATTTTTTTANTLIKIKVFFCLCKNRKILCMSTTRMNSILYLYSIYLYI